MSSTAGVTTSGVKAPPTVSDREWEVRLLFLDEVTTGLDLSVQAKILDLILEIQQQLQVAMIVVTHDLGVIRLLATRTLVMKYGQVVESGLTDQILEDPQHAYTQQLVASAL